MPKNHKEQDGKQNAEQHIKSSVKHLIPPKFLPAGLLHRPEIPDSSWSANLEAGSDFKEGNARCSVRVFERYSMMGGNRLSLTLTMFQNRDSPIRLSAITAGGSQAVFFKVNTIGEESFLDDVKDLLEEILEE